MNQGVEHFYSFLVLFESSKFLWQPQVPAIKRWAELAHLQGTVGLCLGRSEEEKAISSPLLSNSFPLISHKNTIQQVLSGGFQKENGFVPITIPYHHLTYSHHLCLSVLQMLFPIYWAFAFLQVTKKTEQSVVLRM